VYVSRLLFYVFVLLLLLLLLGVVFLSEFIMVYVTAASKVEAEKIACTLLEERIVVCVNILGPVTSRFHWAGKIDLVEEYLLIMKTATCLFSGLEKRVRELHSYEVPEIVAVSIVEGSKSYFDWMISVLNL
jgi:periplasmic divalent cation tolerance protein